VRAAAVDASVRLIATVVKIATPIAPPSWNVVLDRPRRDTRVAFADAGEGRDGRGHEGQTDGGTEDEQAPEDVAEVRSVDRNPGQDQPGGAEQDEPGGRDRPESQPERQSLADGGTDHGSQREHDRGEPELDGRVPEHLLGVQGEHIRHAGGDGGEQHQAHIRSGEGAGPQQPQRQQGLADARLDERGRALVDPAVGAALSLIHADPGRAWTLDTLAGATATGRATLTRRFAALTGQSPMAYVTAWRMSLAARRLRDGDATVRQIAQEVGYDSEFAFARAFKRATGTAPGQYRRLAQTTL